MIVVARTDAPKTGEVLEVLVHLDGWGQEKTGIGWLLDDFFWRGGGRCCLYQGFYKEFVVFLLVLVVSIP